MTPPDQGSVMAMQNSIAAEERASTAARPKGDGRALPRVIGWLLLLSLFGLLAASVAPLDAIFRKELSFLSVGALFVLGGLWLLTSIFGPHAARVSYMRANATHGGARFTRELRPFGHAVVYRTSGGGRAASPAEIAGALSNRVAMNLRALCADREVMTLKAASDATPALMQASDAVIVDLSDGAPADWNAIKPETRRCVFVAAWGVHEQAEATFAALGVPGQCFFYAPDGEIQRRGQFRAAVLAAMRAAHA
ncbi:MAG TPA: hypothetical protein VHC73_03565 [Vitreimonas sp.]|nr:hypothetical protein [Vitreimonas sp.]